MTKIKKYQAECKKCGSDIFCIDLPQEAIGEGLTREAFACLECKNISYNFFLPRENFRQAGKRLLKGDLDGFLALTRLECTHCGRINSLEKKAAGLLRGVVWICSKCGTTSLGGGEIQKNMKLRKVRT